MAALQTLLRAPQKHALPGSQRYFASSAACFKSRPRPTVAKDVRPPISTPSSVTLKDLKLPAGIREWEVLSYASFMKKLQKLNPDVQMTQRLADEALEKSVQALMPKAIWTIVESTAWSKQNPVQWWQQSAATCQELEKTANRVPDLLD